MKTKLTILLIIGLLFIFSCASQSAHEQILNEMENLEVETGRSFITYKVDLSNHSDDLFHVTMYPGGLSAEDKYYNFVAFAPGIHQTLDFGRFVRSFQAFDRNNNNISTEKVSTNQWKISDPERVSYIKYQIEDSFDSGVTEHKIHPMSGTGIENDLILLNSFGVFGYFDALMKKPTRLSLDYNSDWVIGTPLDKDQDGYYIADSYQQLADSPFLIGDLSIASTMIGEISVDVFVYSPLAEINADTVLHMAKEILESAEKFITYAPVNRYVFLLYFMEDEVKRRNGFGGFGGALEHSYSSLYTLPADMRALNHLTNVIGHEFMHILTPLNLRSEIIANFDFSAASSEDMHLWLYEGVTEWASQSMVMRNGLIDIDTHLSTISNKIESSERYDQDYSLTRLSTDWFTSEGQHQYGNIYQLGAVTAEMLDIRLLELSGGKRGFREVYLELLKKYGKDKPFDNATFFETLVEMTYPEIEDFISNHILGTVSLPYEEYYNKLGINYNYSQSSEDKTPVIGLSFGSSDGLHLSIMGFSNGHVNFGLEKGDTILRLFGEELTHSNHRASFDSIKEMNVGDSYEIVVKRGEQELTFTGTLFERMDYHVLTVDENSSEEQNRLREIWSTNLKL